MMNGGRDSAGQRRMSWQELGEGSFIAGSRSPTIDPGTAYPIGAFRRRQSRMQDGANKMTN
jgi:hypothetical protein